MSARQQHFGLSFVLFLVVSWLVGCTQGVGDIDRTQPDLIEKSQFNGKWFIRQSVINVPSTSVAAFEGEMSGMEVITWDIQQNYLVGYRAYELAPGSDKQADDDNALVDDQPVATDAGKGRDPSIYKGNPIVAYAITDHVDVRRQYNPATGEQTNVIEENNYDRPWYDREFMRVDWSVNHIQNPLSVMNPFMFSNPTDISDWIPENEEGSDAFREEKNDKGEVDYMDFTQRIFVKPTYAACAAFYQNQLGDCTDDEVKVRTSLLKVDPEREQDYEPLVYDDNRLAEFGYFRTERPTFDEQRGETYTGLILLGNRHDMWLKSHDDQGVPLAPKDRKLRPISYALSPDFPKDMVETSQEVASDWDAVMKRVAATMREQSVEDLEAELLTDYEDKCLFCLDLNEDGHARNGDLRYNFLYWVTDPQQMGPLGFGPSSAHPETGRIVSGAAYVYGRGIDSSAALGKDVVDLLNGDIKPDNITGGDYVKSAVLDRLKAIDPRALARVADVPLDQLSTTLFGAKGAERIATIQATGLPQARPGFEESQLKRIAGTPLESLLMPEEVRDTFDPGHVLPSANTTASTATDTQTTPSDDSRLSIVNWGSKAAVDSLNQITKKASDNCVWLQQFSDPNVIGLAREARDKGLKGDELYQYLRKQIYRSVMLHELGHTMGLRHNFGGSADTLNYADEYWPLRAKTELPPGVSTTGTLSPWLHSNCAIEDDTNSAGCEEQRSSKMVEYQYSTIMDYGGRFNSDIHGLGHYDAAAIASAYGDLVEVFDESVTKDLSQTVRNGILNANIRGQQSPVSRQGLDYSLGTHYTALPEALGGIANIKNRKWIPRSSYKPSSESGPLKVPYMSCYDEYVDSVETCHRWDIGADSFEITSNLVNSYKQYYVFNNFQRDRVGFSGVSALQRVADRYAFPIANMYQHWLFSAFWRASNSPQGGLAQLGTLEGFDLLWNILTAPSYGSYQKQGDFYTLVSEQMDQSDFTIQPGDGRIQFSRFDYGSGYNVFRRVLESGNYYDQLAALMALTTFDASVVGAGNDVQADVLRYSIPYYLVFSDDLNKLFSSIYRQDPVGYAPTVVGGALRPHSILDSGETPDGYVQSPINYSTRLLTALYGMALFSSNYDTSFAWRGQVALVGSGEVITPGPGFEAVQAASPISGRIYEAYRKIGGEDGPWYAADLIENLAKMVADYDALPDGSQEKDNLRFDIRDGFEEAEILRSMYHTFQYSF